MECYDISISLEKFEEQLREKLSPVPEALGSNAWEHCRFYGLKLAKRRVEEGSPEAENLEKRLYSPTSEEERVYLRTKVGRNYQDGVFDCIVLLVFDRQVTLSLDDNYRIVPESAHPFARLKPIGFIGIGDLGPKIDNTIRSYNEAFYNALKNDVLSMQSYMRGLAEGENGCLFGNEIDIDEVFAEEKRKSKVSEYSML